jgi:hypothetical protein
MISPEVVSGEGMAIYHLEQVDTIGNRCHDEAVTYVSIAENVSYTHMVEYDKIIMVEENGHGVEDY